MPLCFRPAEKYYVTCLQRENQKTGQIQERQIVYGPLIPCILDQPRHIDLSPRARFPVLRLSFLFGRNNGSSSSSSSSSNSSSSSKLLRLRSVLIFGGALIYQRVCPLERPTTLFRADTRPPAFQKNAPREDRRKARSTPKFPSSFPSASRACLSALDIGQKRSN